MKKPLILTISIVLILSIITVFAATEQDGDNLIANISEAIYEKTVTIDPELAKTQVSITADIAHTPYIKESDATFEILTLKGKSLAKKTEHISADTKKVVFKFDIPTYEIGTHFKVRAVDGIDSVIYYEDTYYTGAEFTLPTYRYTDEDGNEIDCTNLAVTINPLYHKPITLYYDGDLTPTTGARVLYGNALVPAHELAEFIGFNVRFDDRYGAEVISIDGKEMYFNLNNTYTTIFGNDVFAPVPTVMIDGTVYISLRTFADAIGSTLEIKDYGTHMDINMTPSKIVTDYFSQLPVNRWGIASRTNYMVWISLSEYKVRLYQGAKNRWRPVYEAPCAIGAPSTPTVTGSFEYQYRDRWNYGAYYVGPCLVFYRGYALHSVLLNYNDTEYDGRVGVKISHGCIRLKKKDIDHIAKTIPVGTRIYITP